MDSLSIAAGVIKSLYICSCYGHALLSHRFEQVGGICLEFSDQQRKKLLQTLSPTPMIYPRYLSASAIVFFLPLITTNDERFGADGVTKH